MEEGLSRNIMVFGLQEGDEESEDLNLKVGAVFGHLGEKPRLEAVRLGKKSQTGSEGARPVKVTLSSSSFVHQILCKS